MGAGAHGNLPLTLISGVPVMMTRYSIGLLACLAFCAGGCKPLETNIVKKLPWIGSSEDDYVTPQRLTAIWTDSIYQRAGKPPTRGFGGRIYFYDGKGGVIPVNGQLVVYAYDDSIAADTNKPTRKYAFTPEQLTKYCSKSDLGTSYNIWLPWDAVGGHEKNISLLTVFVDKSGKIVKGDFASNRLPGKRIMTDEQRRGFYVPRSQRSKPSPQVSTSSDVQQVSYQTPLHKAGSESQSNQRMQVTTIRVPRGLSEHMKRTPIIGRSASSLGQPTSRAPVLPLYNQRPTYKPQRAAPQSAAETRSSQGHTKEPFVPLSRGQHVGAHQAVARVVGSQTPNTGLPVAAESQDLPASAQPGVGTVGVGIRPLGQSGFTGADPQHSMSARSRAWARQDPRSARFGPPKFRVPVAPGERQYRARVRTELSPSAPQRGLPLGR